jgi:xanthine dehydrogenase iron-sulfur cluster and FAD-binding subunit A
MGLFNYIDPTTDIYVFNQDYRMLSGTHKGCTEGNIDTACFLMRSKIIGDVRWHPSDYGADGRFIGDLQANNVVKFIPVFFARYNMLRK